MDSTDAYSVFASMTLKQHEALALASRHLTSKQIALQLGVAPVSIDKRIEAVRAKLGAIPRSDLLRLYSDWCDYNGQSIGGSIILGSQDIPGQFCEGQSPEPTFVFEDSLTFDARAAWERRDGWRRPGFSPSDLGIAGKLLFMLAGSVAIMIVAVLSMAFAGALMSMFER